MASSAPITVDPSSPMHAFEQIKAQITNARALGDLPALHRLPPVRQLAAELGLAPNTASIANSRQRPSSKPADGRAPSSPQHPMRLASRRQQRRPSM